MEVAEERLRRARRWLLGVRVLFYGGAALAAVLLLAGRSSGEPEPGVTIGGRTSQGYSFVMELEPDGRPRHFSTYLVATCPDGRTWDLGWGPTDGAPVPFRIDAGELRVQETGPYRDDDQFEANLHAWVAGGEAAGRLRYVLRVRHADGRRYVCDSGPVRFSAR